MEKYKNYLKSIIMINSIHLTEHLLSNHILILLLIYTIPYDLYELLTISPD